jgi:hypothetical protein
VGVVFSRSTVDDNIGYALTSADVVPRVARAETVTSAVGTGPCTPS